MACAGIGGADGSGGAESVAEDGSSDANTRSLGSSAAIVSAGDARIAAAAAAAAAVSSATHEVGARVNPRELKKARVDVDKRVGREGSTPSWICLRDVKMHSRLLYPNPVCLLLTGCCPSATSTDRNSNNGNANAMVVSWLSPVNNCGRVMLSLNKERFSAEWVTNERHFQLAVPTAQLESVLLKVGSCSGREGYDKFAEVPGLAHKEMMLRIAPKGSREQFLRVVQGCCALLELTVEKLDGKWDERHWIVIAQVQRAFVDERYWDGKNFIARMPGLDPYLTFLGSQTFAHVVQT